MEKKKVIAISIVVIAALSTLCYFLFYVPYENQIAYQQNVECNALVAKYRASQDLIGTVVSPEESHFNKNLNTCLSEEMIVSISTSETQTTKLIYDVVNGKFVVTTGIDTKTVGGISTTTIISGNLVNGVSPDEFAQQEATLMSE